MNELFALGRPMGYPLFGRNETLNEFKNDRGREELGVVGKLPTPCHKNSKSTKPPKTLKSFLKIKEKDKIISILPRKMTD